MDSYIQNLFAERIGGKQFGKEDKIYKFEKIKRAKREAVSKNPDIKLIDLGVGEPDRTADRSVIETLKTEAPKPENRGYSDNGIEQFKHEAADYMKRVFGVPGLDPDSEILHAIGSKSALAMLPSAFINPGDITLMTIPGYPVFGTHAGWYAGEIYPLHLKKENGFLPDIDSIPSDILERAKVIVLNYPNNPTGANADKKFYEKVIEFALRNRIIVIQDAAYAALTYADKPLSFLSIPGAKEVGVELHSLSKAFNMTGWRLAFIAGNELIVKAFANVKDNYDSGQFIAIQKAGITALRNPEITEETRQRYEKRLKALVKILKKCGFDAEMPGGTFYLYVQAPEGLADGTRFESGEDFSQFLIKEKLISTVPWDDAGKFIRFSATFEADSEKDEKQILEEIEKRLTGLQFVF